MSILIEVLNFRKYFVMSVSLQNNFDFGIVSILNILAIYAEAESQTEPQLIKNGIKIIL